jgi:hypothetical protein
MFANTELISVTRTPYSSSPQVTLEKFIPYIGTKTLLLQMLMRGVTVAALHLVHIMFLGVEYMEKPIYHPEWLVFQGEDGEMSLRKPSIISSQARTRCTCRDFYFTCSYYNWEQGCLWGTKMKPYKRLTTTYPPRNPLHVVSACKHIYNATLSLQSRGIVATGG